MDILLCWSQERSRLVARTLRDWLPEVLPGVQPWMSEVDIDKGKDWSNELHSFLSGAKAVIVCITSENVRSPWIYYECGQVAGRNSKNLVCPFLLDEQPSILSDGPLGRSQCTKAEKEDSLRLLVSLNKRLEQLGISESQLEASFESKWNDLSGTLRRLRDMQIAPSPAKISIASEVDQLAGGDLSSEERAIILETGHDRHGRFLHVVTSGGYHFQTNGKDLNAENSPRSTAKWKAALKSLVRRQVLEMRGSKGEVFAMTDKGFQLFDILNRSNADG